MKSGPSAEFLSAVLDASDLLFTDSGSDNDYNEHDEE